MNVMVSVDWQDNKVNGNTEATRMLGSSYLYPAVVPDPYITTVMLRHDDEFIIIANSGLWQHISYAEAVQEVRDLQNPVLASKKLQVRLESSHIVLLLFTRSETFHSFYLLLLPPGTKNAEIYIYTESWQKFSL